MSVSSYGETQEDSVLITSIKQLYIHYKSSSIDECIDVTTKKLEDMRGAIEKTNGRLTKVMHNTNLCILLSGNLLQLGPHFGCRREFSVTWLANSMRVCLGVSDYLNLI